VMFTHGSKESTRLARVFKEMEKEAATVLRAEGFPAPRQRHERSLAMRYRGQSFELEIRNITGDLGAEFHRVHRERYGYAQEQSEIEIVSTRLRSFGIVEKLAQPKIAAGTNRRRGDVYRREDLGAGTKLKTPCIVTEYSGTTLIDADSKARIDSFGNILITVG
jgi:N-methylhydantoinase A